MDVGGAVVEDQQRPAVCARALSPSVQVGSDQAQNDRHVEHHHYLRHTRRVQLDALLLQLLVVR